MSLPFSAEVPSQFVLKMWQYEIMPCTPSVLGRVLVPGHTWVLSLFMCCAAYGISTGGGFNWQLLSCIPQLFPGETIHWWLLVPKTQPTWNVWCTWYHTAELIGLKGHISFINCTYIHIHMQSRHYLLRNHLSYMCNIVCVQLLVLCKNYWLLCNSDYSSW